MSRWAKRVLEWLGHYGTIQSILHAEFVRTVLTPLLGTAAAGLSGYFGGVPIMWVIVACALTFMALALAMLAIEALKTLKSPANKLVVVAPMFNRDLAEAPLLLAANRRARRAQGKDAPQMLSSNSLAPGVKRYIDKAQLGIKFRNTATFPISCVLYQAETEIEGTKPPRSIFPRPPSVIQPGTEFTVSDDSIDLDEFPCQRLAGKLDMRIKYGVPGKEVFDLHLVGDVDIEMEDFGLVNQVRIGWHN